MKDATFTGQNPRTDDEYKAQIDQMAVEIRQMLDETRRTNEESARLSVINRKTLSELETMVLCGKA